MSSAAEGDRVQCCASCGIAGFDDVKLKDCDDFDLVRYCSDECQKDHRQKHEEECKQRAAGLRDELLFKQPESTHEGNTEGEMSAAAEEDTIKVVQHCASCCIAGDDDIIKLKDCDGCDLVRYCSNDCQQIHKSEHKEACKKRAAELHDEILFKQPESNNFGDCPICCLPLPLDPQKSVLYSCCSKRICKGCDLANQKREAKGRLRPKCAFCRKALPKTDAEWNKQLMKRIEANDPVAISETATRRYNEGDCKIAVEYLSRAAALGDAEANYQFSTLYHDGDGVEKDEKRELHHLTEAAIAGHPDARHNLGCMEGQNGRVDRAAKHFIIAAKLGYDDSLKAVKNLYKTGHVSKEDFAAALRGHHAAIVAMKSPQREEAYELDLNEE